MRGKGQISFSAKRSFIDTVALRLRTSQLHCQEQDPSNFVLLAEPRGPSADLQPVLSGHLQEILLSLKTGFHGIRQSYMLRNSILMSVG